MSEIMQVRPVQTAKYNRLTLLPFQGLSLLIPSAAQAIDHLSLSSFV